MKKLITLLSAISIVLISCQQNLSPEIPAPADEVMTKSLSAGRVEISDPFIFSAAKDMKSFTDIGPLEDRFAACEVPVSRLDAMTTEALVKSMLNYPLNYLVFFYNDPQDAIDLIVGYSPLHQEFLSRSDAAEVFVDFYAAADLDISPEKGNLDGNYTSLSYTNTMFMDHFIGSGLMTGLHKASVKQKLAEAVSEKLQERIKNTNVFSDLSIRPLLKVNETAVLGINVNEITTRTTIKTDILPRGKEYSYHEYSEASASDLNMLTQAATTNYPNAILKGPSTMKYNSHSYAWLDSNTTNSKYLEGGQLYNFIGATDSYLLQSCNNESSAKIVRYLNADHSAVRINSNTYVSKWGFGPLMQHSPSYCPYVQTDMRYYEPIVTYGKKTISGNSQVTLNQANDYTISGTGTGFTYEFNVLFMDAPSPTPFVVTQVSDTKYRLICQDYGYFKLEYNGYFNGYCFDINSYYTVCVP